MATDRTTKILLTMIAVALWGLLLKPLFAPTPSLAAPHNQGTMSVSIDGTRYPIGIPVGVMGHSHPSTTGGGEEFENDVPVYIRQANPVMVKIAKDSAATSRSSNLRERNTSRHTGH